MNTADKLWLKGKIIALWPGGRRI